MGSQSLKGGAPRCSPVPPTAPLAGVRVLFAGLREPAYVRNAVLLRALRDAGAEVRVLSSSARSYPVRALVTLWRLAWRVPRRSTYDVVLAAFLGQPVAALLGRGRPVVLDQFISVYDTLCLDRRAVKPEGWLGRRLRGLDRRACRAAAAILVDTQAQADFLPEVVGPLPVRPDVLPVGADEAVFAPAAEPEAPRTVFYYSTDLPLHGLPTVVAAAALLEKDGIQFRIAGHRPAGPSPANVAWLGWVPVAAIAAEARRAALCLAGHFAVNAKAQRVVPGKAYQFMALARPMVAGRGPGNDALLRDGHDAYFCAPGSPEDLARAIRAALADPGRLEVGRRARATYERVAGAAVQQRIVADVVRRVLGR